MSHFHQDPTREPIRARQLVRLAMLDADERVIEFDYEDAQGNISRRVASPIRFLGNDRFLALCLCREEPRQFHLSRCRAVQLRSANDYVMPVPIYPVATASEPGSETCREAAALADV